jgi:hypothetical protein
MDDRYLEPHQARKRAPTAYEDLLADSLERAFTVGTHDLSELVAYLNNTGPSAMSERAWDEESLKAELGRLANRCCWSSKK